MLPPQALGRVIGTIDWALGHCNRDVGLGRGHVRLGSIRQQSRTERRTCAPGRDCARSSSLRARTRPCKRSDGETVTGPRCHPVAPSWKRKTASIYMAMSLQNVGTGIAVILGWRVDTGQIINPNFVARRDAVRAANGSS